MEFAEGVLPIATRPNFGHRPQDLEIVTEISAMRVPPGAIIGSVFG